MQKYSYEPELEDMMTYVSENCPKRYIYLLLRYDLFSEGLDKQLRYMLNFGKQYWFNLELIEFGAPSLN